MKIIKDELYPDIYGLYLYYLDKGYNGGLTIEDYKVLKQLQKDLSWDLVKSDIKWFRIYAGIDEIKKEMFNQGLLHKYDEETIYYILENVPILPLVLANNTGEYKTEKEKIRIYSDLSYMFRCHFHNEKTPSMGVSIDRNLFHCFGCGESGNQIGYIMQYENLSYTEAIRLVAEIYRINLEEKTPLKSDNLALVKKYQAAITSKEYKELLRKGAERLKRRKIDKIGEQTVEDFYKNQYAIIKRIKKRQNDSSYKHTPQQKQKIYLK